jgi:DNA repair ATPase RecN
MTKFDIREWNKLNKKFVINENNSMDLVTEASDPESMYKEFDKITTLMNRDYDNDDIADAIIDVEDEFEKLGIKVESVQSEGTWKGSSFKNVEKHGKLLQNLSRKYKSKVKSPQLHKNIDNLVDTMYDVAEEFED